MLKRSGFPAPAAGGLLSAAGIGATLSPPTLGAAAFIIADYLGIDYFDVLVMATIPTILYYLSAWFMVEADSRKLAIRPIRTSDQSLSALTLSQGYHFISLVAIAVLLAYGMSAFLAVFWSIVIAVVLSLIRSDQRLLSLEGAGLGLLVSVAAAVLGQRLSVAAFWGLAAGAMASIAAWLYKRSTDDAADAPAPRLIATLVEGGKGCIGVAATCATAGIIVSIINLSGLGLKLSGLIVDFGAGSLLVTILLAAIAMWVLGTAIPVTASYIIAAVVLVPALVSLGVPPPAAHMFMFYYAVLADVSPPTALAPFAAAAICGGSPVATTMQAWKYTLPAFVVPVMFCLSPDGLGLLLESDWETVVWMIATSGLALAGFAIAASGWIAGRLAWPERMVAALGGVALMAPHLVWEMAGAVALSVVLGLHILRARAAGG
jgi:TRAP transporter 4TM/12TM fusion protein